MKKTISKQVFTWKRTENSVVCVNKNTAQALCEGFFEDLQGPPPANPGKPMKWLLRWWCIYIALFATSAESKRKKRENRQKKYT